MDINKTVDQVLLCFAEEKEKQMCHCCQTSLPPLAVPCSLELTSAGRSGWYVCDSEAMHARTVLVLNQRRELHMTCDLCHRPTFFHHDKSLRNG
jgi:hypothetical protein